MFGLGSLFGIGGHGLGGALGGAIGGLAPRGGAHGGFDAMRQALLQHLGPMPAQPQAPQAPLDMQAQGMPAGAPLHQAPLPSSLGGLAGGMGGAFAGAAMPGQPKPSIASTLGGMKSGTAKIRGPFGF